MADNLIFPIRFDLQKGVEEASKDWDKYAAKLEKEIQKRAVKVKLSLDTRNLDNLDAVKQRLAQLKIEPITPETKSAIKELAQELKQLAKALEQVQKYSSKNVGTSEVRSARVLEIEAKAAAAKELARQRAAKAEQAELKLAAAREKSAAAANRAATSVNNLTKAYGLQSSYIERLLGRLAALWSVRQVQSFLTNIRNVTAEFELQRVSLGAIIQDQQRANRLFSEIKTFALKSPVTILDLTKYTKQVAAYGIETEKLFDTTKRLADVSVGLGVDMGRVTLAYGQVKAASYLRAAEIRQFTEAGIPMLELLAKKFTELNGEMVTTEQVMDMVSKRGVDFKMVEEIFYDMTSAGGMFYNMQEKQGNTLYGMWSKLGDAASMMYDEIGNTEWVNEGMKAGIQFLTDLMKKWRDVAGSIAIISALYVKYRISAANAAIAEKLLSDATMQKVLALSFEKNALMQKMAMQTKTTLLTRIDNAVTLASIKAKIAAATATNIFTKALYSLKAALLSNPWTALFAAVAAAAMYFYNARQEANKLRKELDNISAERLTLTSQSVRNFEYLANAAVTAADGSKKQKDALDELHRTYRDMIPVEDLTIEKLRAMHGNYQQLTTVVREYIAAQQEQKAISAIQEEYAGILTTKGRAARNEMKNMGLSDTEIDRFFIHFNKVAENSVMSFRQNFEKAVSDTGLDNVLEVKWHVLGGVEQMYGNPDIYALGQELMGYNEALDEQSNRLINLRKEYDALKGELGEYQEALERVENLFNDGFVLTDITSGELVGGRHIHLPAG